MTFFWKLPFSDDIFPNTHKQDIFPHFGKKALIWSIYVGIGQFFLKSLEFYMLANGNNYRTASASKSSFSTILDVMSREARPAINVCETHSSRFTSIVSGLLSIRSIVKQLMHYTKNERWEVLSNTRYPI